ncbi:NTP transferase domain-containing protein [Nocardioides houyundeii]|uniref:NTP transferase domain-containing protein n=1 Tax=Nocardioides houyundeii TaxID=2045452 RepID=UPI000DF179B1|nr:NTP transferase domain-containing protein [Nocardioides houyundeii]
MSDRRTSGEPLSLVIPVKETWRAKSRLALDPAVRPLVARRVALATTQAALDATAVGAVWVVTRDQQVAALVRELGALVVPEVGVSGLNAAADLGRRAALDSRPHAPVGILVADLPLLRSADLDLAVAEFRSHGEPMRVSDHHDVGTTLLVQGPRDWPGIGFGGRSAELHLRLGYRPWAAAPDGLRRDLDTLDDLALVRARSDDTARTLRDLVPRLGPASV